MSRHLPATSDSAVEEFHATGAVELSDYEFDGEIAGRPLHGSCHVRILSHDFGAVVVIDAGEHSQALISSLPRLLPRLAAEFSLPDDPKRIWVIDHHQQSELAPASSLGVRDGFTRIHLGRGNHSEGNCAWEPISNPQRGYERVAALLGDQFAEWYPHLLPCIHDDRTNGQAS